jgi:hypothetical protein
MYGFVNYGYFVKGVFTCVSLFFMRFFFLYESLIYEHFHLIVIYTQLIFHVVSSTSCQNTKIF